MKECKCTFAQKMVGDGCSICNPQLMIEMLQEQIKKLQATIEAQEIIIKDKSKHIEQIESYTDISYIKAGVFNSKPKVQP